jgi:alkaline phosphatase
LTTQRKRRCLPWAWWSWWFVATPDLEKVAKLPVLGLFADKKMDFAIDQKSGDKTQPTLLQMTKKALDLLHNDKGFFLVVEGKANLACAVARAWVTDSRTCVAAAGRIDECAYAHDAACLAHEVLALQESFDAVADLLVKTKDTACLIASDRDSGSALWLSHFTAIMPTNHTHAHAHTKAG